MVSQPGYEEMVREIVIWYRSSIFFFFKKKKLAEGILLRLITFAGEDEGLNLQIVASVICIA